MFDSGKTRRQIGIRKRQLISQCETIKQILHDHDLPEKSARFTPFSSEELIDLREEKALSKLWIACIRPTPESNPRRVY
ncbi:unnamed protein product [Heligmosomoides polygyrus]|uniref:Transposase n=1 Tax=Heligmosomoides polygyrus TaxID=6339 RepID=A0A183FTN9_HELPZ|nr:unnamed protein product [Heligmosomoides polygyrus]